MAVLNSKGLTMTKWLQKNSEATGTGRQVDEI